VDNVRWVHAAKTVARHHFNNECCPQKPRVRRESESSPQLCPHLGKNPGPPVSVVAWYHSGPVKPGRAEGRPQRTSA
jgi:proteasome lid subunit RPN8/RPN11